MAIPTPVLPSLVSLGIVLTRLTSEFNTFVRRQRERGLPSPRGDFPTLKLEQYLARVQREGTEITAVWRPNAQ